MVPAGIAAAAAAAEAGLHGGRRSDGSGRQRRSSRSGVKHRKSDTGAVRPRRRSSSNGDGPGSGSPYRKHGSRQSSNTNLAQGRKSGTGAASDGGGGGAAVNASWPPGRRKSDNPGGLPTAASAPVVDGSPGRLPRIAASGAAAVGSPKESSKPLTLAQGVPDAYHCRTCMHRRGRGVQGAAGKAEATRAVASVTTALRNCRSSALPSFVGTHTAPTCSGATPRAGTSRDAPAVDTLHPTRLNSHCSLRSATAPPRSSARGASR